MENYGKFFSLAKYFVKCQKALLFSDFAKYLAQVIRQMKNLQIKKILQGKANTHLLLWFFRLRQTDLCLLKNNGLAHLDDLKSTAIAPNGPDSLNIKLKHLWSSFGVFN